MLRRLIEADLVEDEELELGPEEGKEPWLRLLKCLTEPRSAQSLP